MFIEHAQRTGAQPGIYAVATPDDIRQLLQLNFRRAIKGQLVNPGAPHAIYAAAWERTGALELLRDAVDAVLGGPDLGRLDVGGLLQAEATASLLLRDPLPGSPLDVTTSLRPDADACRSALYQRLFGSFVAPVDPQLPSNDAFSRWFGELLELGLAGACNVNNTTGPNCTRPAQIARIARRIRESFAATRPAGLVMSREEFASVTLAGWVELTFSGNSPLLVNLGATGNTPAERIERLATATGVDQSGLDPLLVDLIEAARPLSNLLGLIEHGELEPPANPADLWTNAASLYDLESVAETWADLVGDEAAKPALPACPERLQLRIAS